ncbi:antirestriction protein [Caballeronia pedi]|uniref:Antirestriction protein n=1 Tax=Caballeronia pedi TaxID=1777141 RepID=A0A158B335_9BURK|nr:antirestriction protein [Caballeronia pedi]SAK63707.1 antirestriction protein [Caballeronia pedi]
MKEVIATPVPASKRLAFMPEAFTPRVMIKAEGLVYHQAAMLSRTYQGGLWQFYTLSNGGYYLAPETDKRFPVQVTGNSYEGEVSADAFGVIVTLFVYGALVWIDNAPLREKYSDHYHQLRAFACQHPEANAILRAID